MYLYCPCSVRRLQDDGAASHESWGNLKNSHLKGIVPWCDSRNNTDRSVLFHNSDVLVVF